MRHAYLLYMAMFFLNHHDYCAICLKKKRKFSDVDMPQRKYLREVRIESKIATLRLIKLNKSFASLAV